MKTSKLLNFFFLVALPCFSIAEETQEKIIPQEQLVYIETSEGLVIIELAPFIAPNHVKQFTNLIKEGFYNGLDFYRVIDGFVVQAGDEKETKDSQHKSALKAEFTRPLGEGSDFVKVQSPELLAESTGYINGFPAGQSKADKVEWLLHCPGAVAMARKNEADSGKTDFYIVIGHAPRHLDRNMSVFGQVIYGMENVQAIKRGDPRVNSGVIEDISARSKIFSAIMGSELKKVAQMTFVRPMTSSNAFQKRLQSARTLDNDFYHYKGSGNLDVCYYKPRTTLKEPVDSE